MLVGRSSPRRAWRAGLWAAALGAALAGVPRGAAAAAFSDEAVEKAIERGAKYLWSRQEKNGSWKEDKAGAHGPYKVGAAAICTYALLESGVPLSDRRMARALEFLKKTEADRTYCLAFRALAYSVACRQDPAYRALLRDDIVKLMKSMDRYGGYTYVAHGRGPKPDEYADFAGKAADQSNTQYGLLGVWAGAMRNLEVPYQFWEISLNYWQRWQQSDGGWGYSPKGKKDTYMPMTLAGLASVYVCFDEMYAGSFLRCRGNAGFPAAERAVAWVQKHYGEIARETQAYYYTLYGLERVGLATGLKYFGGHDWYKDGAKALLGRQEADGSWAKPDSGISGGPCSMTSYAMLFLLRGRRPVLFNRLQFEGDWNNRPRALANLTRWFSSTFERDVHWQIVNLQAPVEDWHDAPILCLTGSESAKLSDGDLGKLRTFIHQGGTLLTVDECSGAGFNEQVREAIGRLFPTYPLAECGQDHPIYDAYNHLAMRPKLFEVSNGARPLVIHSDSDLAQPWQGMQHLTQKWAFDAAANIVAYTNDKTALAGELRYRGTTLWPATYGGATEYHVRLARLRHGGNYDPEPLAYERFGRLIGHRAKTRLDVLGPMPIAELPRSGVRLAALTGTGRLELTSLEQDTLKKWIEAGGTLLIDAAGGDKPFAESAEAALDAMFGPRSARPMAVIAPLFKLPGFEINDTPYRRSTWTALGRSTTPRLRAVMLGDRPGAILSREDITCGLVGYPSYTVFGYTPETCYELLRNICLAFGTPDGPRERAPEASSPDQPAPRPRLRLSASASLNAEAVANAVDGKGETRWDTARPMRSGEWFQIDLGDWATVRRVTLDASGSPNDYPRGYQVFLSADGNHWGKHVLEGKGKGPRTVIDLRPPQRTRFIRIVQTGKDGKHYWSIHELKVETE